MKTYESALAGYRSYEAKRRITIINKVVQGEAVSGKNCNIISSQTILVVKTCDFCKLSSRQATNQYRIMMKIFNRTDYNILEPRFPEEQIVCI